MAAPAEMVNLITALKSQYFPRSQIFLAFSYWTKVLGEGAPVA